MENKRRKIIPIETLETAKPGFANGISTQLQSLIEKNEHRSLNQEEKQVIIENASVFYGHFLTALGVNWKDDPNSMETPKRVAKSFVNELWYGRYNLLNEISSFPNEYEGCITQTNIRLRSMCSHHHREIYGYVHISYCPGMGGKVIGLSKLNRIVEHFGRRGNIQEDLTEYIHKAVNNVCEKNLGVAVQIVAEHSCIKCRATNDESVMVTTRLSGVYKDNNNLARYEFFDAIKSAHMLK